MACCLPTVCPPLCSISCCSCYSRPRAGQWRYVYFVCFSLCVVLSWVLRDYWAQHMQFFPAIRQCETEACMGKQAVLRVSLGTCLFFSVMCVATLGVRRPASCRGVLHTRCFALMLPAWAGLVALSFLPSNGDINSYFEVARAGGAAFLLLQLVIIMDLVYTTNERWLEQDDTLSRVKLIAGAFLFNAGTVAGIVCMYVYLGVFARDIAFISVTLLLFVIFTTLSLLPRVSGGIFTSGTVAAYCVFLCATAIMSDPAHAGAPPRWLQALGFAIALTALLRSTFSATAHARTFEVAHAAPSPRAAGCLCCGDADEDEPDEVHPLTYSFFHAVFALGAMYAAMLFTSWSAAETFSQWDLDKGEASLWVKIGCEWAAAAIYLWILLAPLLFPNRDFS